MKTTFKVAKTSKQFDIQQNKAFYELHEKFLKFVVDFKCKWKDSEDAIPVDADIFNHKIIAKEHIATIILIRDSINGGWVAEVAATTGGCSNIDGENYDDAKKMFVELVEWRFGKEQIQGR